MAVSCTFTLNKKDTSDLVCPGVGNFPAFSGQGVGRNNPDYIKKVDIGPLPKGDYYILDRESGGLLGPVHDFFNDLFGTDRSQWFALYRKDKVIDDMTFVDGVSRGNFRLHPIGPARISKGCITLVNPPQFDLLAKQIRSGKTMTIPQTALTAYGTVTVK